MDEMNDTIHQSEPETENTPASKSAEESITETEPKRKSKIALALIVLLCSFGILTGIFLLFMFSLALSSLADPMSVEHGSTLWLSIVLGLFSAALLTLSIQILRLSFTKRNINTKTSVRKFVKTIGIFSAIVSVLIIFCFISGNRSKEYYYEGSTFTFSVHKGKHLFEGRRVEITGLTTDSAVPERLVIPEKIKNVKVRSIGEGAFRDLTGVKEVVLPDTIEIISPYAFSGCASLEKVTLADKMESVGDCAFSNCKSLRQINKPNGFNYLFSGYSPCTIAATAFSGCPSAPEWTHDYGGG